MNLFARGLGGFFSDLANKPMGMRGRILVQTVCLVGEGIMVLIFANSKSLGLAIFYLVIFSLFVQAAEGSSFGIVPYVDPPATGSIAGIVGAGGNVGAVSFGICFRELDYKPAFYIMGFSILATAAMSSFIYIKGCSALFFGTDTVVYGAQPGDSADKTLTVPEPETATASGKPRSPTKLIPVKDYEEDYDAEEVEA
jgi:MFS transporter, NNP family, nitrate/nitrite transporter